MTTLSPLFGQFGTTLAFAERTLTRTLREHLAKRGIVPETWYASSWSAPAVPACRARS